MVPHNISLAECEQSAELLRDYFRRSTRVIDRMMAGHGASYARARLLIEIAKHGPLRSSDLAASFNFAPRTVTEAIDGMERDGLVRRDADPDDRRAKRISLTPAGVAAVAATEAAWRRFVEEVFGVLTPEEHDALVKVIGKLNDRLQGLGRSYDMDPPAF